MRDIGKYKGLQLQYRFKSSIVTLNGVWLGALISICESKKTFLFTYIDEQCQNFLDTFTFDQVILAIKKLTQKNIL